MQAAVMVGTLSLRLVLLCTCFVLPYAQNTLNFTQSVHFAHGREDIKHLSQMQDAVVPFSALRNPVEMTVKVLFEAEGYMAKHFSCHFSRDLLVDGPHESRLHTTEGALHQVGHTERRYTGYMLACQDPGPEYEYFAFVTQQDNTGLGPVLLKSINITTIETTPEGVGWCLSSLYSPRVGFDNWARSVVKAGFSNIYVYYTKVQDREALSLHYGTSDSQGDFAPQDLPQVQYHYFQPPAQTWTFAESTMYTECIHRNRLKHKFLAIADSDEFFWRQPSEDSLEEFLESLLPSDTASLVFPDIMYPEGCQDSRSDAHGVDPLHDSHFYWPTKQGTQPKSIVMPTRSFMHRVHTLAATEPTYWCCKDVPPNVGHFKHVRQSGGRCGHQRKHLYDDRDAATFHEVMSNESLWLPAYF